MDWTVDNNGNECGNCLWFQETEAKEGFCYYEPPQVFAVYDRKTKRIERVTCRPEAYARSICSKHTPIPGVTPTPTP
jgi:hypothetical protein